MSDIDLTSKEAQEAIKAKAQEIFDEKAGGLKKKNEELMDEVKELKTKFKDFDPEEYKKLKAARQKADDEGSDPVQLRKRIEDEFAPKLTQAEKERDEARKALDNLQIENQLTSSLTEVGVPKEFLRAVKADILSARRERIEVKDGGVIVDGAPVADFAKKWAGDEANKSFIAAPDNRGGGAGGGGGGGGAGEKKTSEMNREEKAGFIGKHGLEAWKQKVNNESHAK